MQMPGRNSLKVLGRDYSFALRHFAPVIAERRIRDFPPYFKTMRDAHAHPIAEIAALSYPLGIHCVPSHETRPDSVTRGRLAILSDFKIDSSPSWVCRVSHAQNRFSDCCPLE